MPPPITACIRALAIAAIGLALSSGARAGPVDRLPSSNGYGLLLIDAERPQLVDFFPAVFKHEGPETPVPDLAFDAYLGLVIAGEVIWLRDVAPDQAGYVPGSNVVRFVQRVQGRTVTSWWWAPWAWAAPAFAFEVQVAGAQEGDRIVSLANLHLGRCGAEGCVGAEETRPEDGAAVREAGDRFTVLHQPTVPPSGIAAPPLNPFVLASAGTPFPPPPVELQVSDNAVVGFQWDAAGGTITGGAVIGQRPERGPPAIDLQAELAGWDAWIEGLSLPDPGDPVDRQQAAFLRMGQVKTQGRGRGQIVASLPPGNWNIAWVRDMAYAVAALSQIGALDEAWAAIEFQLGAEAGFYRELVGRDYLISVTRYFGNGREESDPNENGPNIEWDDFGLFLWSVGRWVQAGGDVERLRPEWPRIERGVLEVIESLVDPELDLLRPDSSIWERHWEGGDLNDGLRQRFSYSTIVNAAGLCHAARVADALNGAGAGDRWRRLAHRLRAGLREHLIDGAGVLGASYEQVQSPDFSHLDLAVADAFAMGLLPPDGPIAQASWAAFEAGLRLAPDRGFKRNDDGERRANGDPFAPGWYDQQEWIFVDLRAEIWRRAGDLPGADLRAFVRALAEGSFLIVPELLGERDRAFEGAWPMVGFGAGAWFLSAEAPEIFCAPAAGAPDAGAIADADLPRDAAIDAGAADAGDGRAAIDASDAGPSSSDGGDAPPVRLPDMAPIDFTDGDRPRRPQDAGRGRDAIVRPDASVAGDPAEGCGCRSGQAAPAGPLALLMLLAIARRRRGDRRWRG